EPSDEEVEAFFAEPSPEKVGAQLLSPVVRRLVRENQVDLSQVKGTGEGGRVTRKDIEAHLESRGAAPAEPTPAPEPAPAAAAPPAAPDPAPAPERAATAEQPAAAAKEPEAGTPPAPATREDRPGEERELDRLRVRVAENLIKAKQTAAHVWTSVEVDFERL